MFPIVGRKHITLGICVSKVGEHILLGICVSQVGEQNLMSRGLCLFQVGVRLDQNKTEEKIHLHV